jgi:hypothetical protein
MNENLALLIDAIVNLVLGIPLLFFSQGLAEVLGLPFPISDTFYPSLLGGVLVGIGLALLVQRVWGAAGVVGLGIEGAIVINLCGAATLVVWLIVGDLDVPVYGYALLWGFAALVLGLALYEMIIRFRQAKARERT